MPSRIIRPLVNGLLDLVFPPVCLLCRSPLPASEPAAQLCPRCLATIPGTVPAFCRKCPRHAPAHGTGSCGRCRPNALQFDRCWSAVLYNDTMRHLLHLFKYGQTTSLRILFADMMIRFIDKHHIPIHTCDLIIPVPLHPVRQRERGFNQSELIALILAEHFQIPCQARSVKRVRHTLNQARVKAKQRWTNIEGTFTIIQPDVIYNTNILLIDDLMTTGATLSGVAGALKTAGAKTIYGLTTAVAA